MARILTVEPEQTRGLRRLLFWVNKRQYGGVVPGIFKIMFRDLNIASPPAGSTITCTCARARP